MDLSSNALAKESIAYRFESQTTIDDAKEQRDMDWKAAYERLVSFQAFGHQLDILILMRNRLGQKPPDRPEEPVDDGKTLYEVCSPLLTIAIYQEAEEVEITNSRTEEDVGMG